MPIYEYECCRCHYRFELRQGFSAEPVSSCPECQGTVRRVIQPVGIVFKGSGFYATDNRSNGNGQAGKKQSEPEATKEPAETKTEAKAETKSDTSTSKEASASAKETPK